MLCNQQQQVWSELQGCASPLLIQHRIHAHPVAVVRTARAEEAVVLIQSTDCNVDAVRCLLWVISQPQPQLNRTPPKLQAIQQRQQQQQKEEQKKLSRYLDLRHYIDITEALRNDDLVRAMLRFLGELTPGKEKEVRGVLLSERSLWVGAESMWRTEGCSGSGSCSKNPFCFYLYCMTAVSAAAGVATTAAAAAVVAGAASEQSAFYRHGTTLGGSSISPH